MSCFRPLKAYRAVDGGVTFSRKKGYVDRPVELPCGKCDGCRMARSKQWALRCVHEASLHERNSFLTLTYSQEFLPSDLSVDVTHWQKFAKKLRKAYGPFRYLHCGEYGDRNSRPHYHACMFGLDFSEDRELVSEDGRYKTYRSSSLDRIWGKGFCTIGNLTEESAAYVARYVLKKATDKSGEQYRRAKIDPDTGEWVEWKVRPEYITMSRRPGLGSGWIKKFEGDVYPSDEVVSRGFKHRPPRYYDDQMEKKDPEFIEGVKSKRRAKVNKELHTPERREARERILTSKIGRLQRNL